MVEVTLTNPAGEGQRTEPSGDRPHCQRPLAEVQWITERHNGG